MSSGIAMVRIWKRREERDLRNWIEQLGGPTMTRTQTCFLLKKKKKKNTYLNASQASVVVPYCQEIYP